MWCQSHQNKSLLWNNLCTAIYPTGFHWSVRVFVLQEVQVYVCTKKIYIFFYQGFLLWTLTTYRTAGEERGPFFIPLYHFHPLSNLQTFICNACFYHTATRWDFTTLLNYHLIDWWCEFYFSLFTWWFDTRFLLQQSWSD